MDVSRPIVRYFGGKWKMAPWIVSHFPPHKIYTEAFGGGASVLLRKPRAPVEIYNDLDERMVNLFRVLRDNGDELRRLIELTPYSRTEFFSARETTNDPIEAARRVAVRGGMGYSSNSLNNGLDGFKTQICPEYNYPEEWESISNVVSEVAKRMKGVCIENKDAEALLKECDGESTLHFVDPPYAPETRTAGEYLHEMHSAQHEELLRFLCGLKGMVALSGYRCELYDDMLSGWQRFDKPSRSGKSDRTESIWLNPKCIDVSSSYLF